jgi:hypothetical protein
VRDLVDDRPADLVGYLLLGLADRADRLAVNGDPRTPCAVRRGESDTAACSPGAALLG